MAEYIEREALIAKFKSLPLGANSLMERFFCDGVYNVLETFPAADVVEVVRCYECRMYEENKEAHTSHCRRELNYLYVKPDGGCTYGVRKDGIE